MKLRCLILIIACGLSIAACQAKGVEPPISLPMTTSPPAAATPVLTQAPVPSSTALQTKTVSPSTATQTSEPGVYCANPYWPIKVGATWIYAGNLTIPESLATPEVTKPITETWKILSVEGDHPLPARFILEVNGTPREYLCDATGIYSIAEDGEAVLSLPPPEKLIPGEQIEMPFPHSMIIDQPTTITIPLGTYEVQPIEVSPGEGNAIRYYAKDIGLIRLEGGYFFYIELTLVEYHE